MRYLQTVAQAAVRIKMVTTEKDLAEAVKSQQDIIIIEGRLGNKVFRIMATGKIAWGIAIGAIGILLVAILATPATGGTSNFTHVVAVPAAMTALGSSAATAIAIAAAGGGVAVLNQLRKYKIIERSENRLVLKHR